MKAVDGAIEAVLVAVEPYSSGLLLSFECPLCKSSEAYKCYFRRTKTFLIRIQNLLWNPKFYYRVHKSPPHVPKLSQMSPDYSLTYYFSKIRFNNISIF
jgi:hypothetical protein